MVFSQHFYILYDFQNRQKIGTKHLFCVFQNKKIVLKNRKQIGSKLLSQLTEAQTEKLTIQCGISNEIILDGENINIYDGDILDFISQFFTQSF